MLTSELTVHMLKYCKEGTSVVLSYTTLHFISSDISLFNLHRNIMRRDVFPNCSQCQQYSIRLDVLLHNVVHCYGAKTVKKVPSPICCSLTTSKGRDHSIPFSMETKWRWSWNGIPRYDLKGFQNWQEGTCKYVVKLEWMEQDQCLEHLDQKGRMMMMMMMIMIRLMMELNSCQYCLYAGTTHLPVSK